MKTKMGDDPMNYEQNHGHHYGISDGMNCQMLRRTVSVSMTFACVSQF
jgi:hypothetical protein